ncbi:MAG: response regulator, partial [Candidatus Lokiarchaeota archaeon]|nr:response regulator [Candidatus Lokiarchaeota archaeon]
NIDDILVKIGVFIEEQKLKKQNQKGNLSTTNENILIVDDDESTCKTLALIFNKKGYNVQTAGTGHEALEIARNKNFNLALLDIKLPDIEGIELLVPLKKMHPDMETMMMTAYSSLETVVRALNEGASAYIMKPLEIDDILNKISTMFEKQHLIAEKKKLEQELAYQALLMENVSDAIISTDKNLNVKSWNKAAEIMYGFNSDEVIGKPMSEIIPEEYPYVQKGDVNEQIFENGFWKGEINQKKKDNSIINIFSSSTLIKDNMGKIQGVVTINKDITESKKGEQDLLSSIENLKYVNIELERFAYVASHDLQEPLRMIVSFIQLLEKRYKGKLDEEADEFIAFIVDGAKRMQSLITDLLLYSRIGRKEKEFSQLDVTIIVEVVISNLRKIIEETNAKITYDPLPKLIGNEAEFVQLLQNLILNAIKFHKKEETPVVHISAKLQKNQWIISVRDNGIGIDSQFFDRIFIIFQRLHKKDEYAGTGIGLAICKKVIERHDGKIWVESELGKGSTFYFSIPEK